MKTSIQGSSAAYQSCLDEALRQSLFVIERWCSKLTGALSERSMTVLEAEQKHEIQRAIAALKKNRILIEQGFAGELDKAIERDASPGAARGTGDSAHSFSAPSFDELELMRNDQVQLAVESARLQQVIALACEAGFSSFCARLSAVQGFQLVKGKGNALRPETIAEALFKLLRSLDVNSRTRGYWLIDGAQIMGAELQSLYVLLTNFLVAQGTASGAGAIAASAQTSNGKIVQVKKMNVLQTPPNGLASAASGPGKLAEAPKSEPRQLLTMDNLHRLLSGDRDSALEGVSLLSSDHTDEVVHHEFSHTLPGALYVLAELEAQDVGNRSPAMVRLLPSESVLQMRAHLKKNAKSLGQSLAIEVIGVMIEQIANNDRLLLPVRQVVANAEPAFLRLAVTDPRFFSDKSHPARRLLDAITSASMGFASESSAGFPGFMISLREVAVLLTEELASDAQHFARLLDNFERKQDRNSPEYRQSQQRAEQALMQAELRNLVAAKIAAEIKLRSDFAGVKPVVAAFATGPWAQVLATERLLGKSASPDWNKTAFGQTLGDVLWTMNVAQESSHPTWLLEIIPGMLKSLREGLLLIDYPPAQSRPFFDELMACHQRAHGTLTETPAPSATPRNASSEIFVTDDDDQSSVQPWIAPAEAQDSGFMQESDVPDAPVPSFVPPESRAEVAARPSELPASVRSAELHLGAWIELLVDTRWLRAQLTWVSPRNTLFMFTSDGGRKHSMTVRILHHLREKNFVKVISQQGALDSALDKVAQTAMRNSVASD